VVDFPDSTRDARNGDRLGEVVAEYLAGAEQGGPVDRQAFLARHPEFAAELSELFEQEDHFLSVVGPYRAQRGEDRIVSILSTAHHRSASACHGVDHTTV
jgi:hypothetical protein